MNRLLIFLGFLGITNCFMTSNQKFFNTLRKFDNDNDNYFFFEPKNNTNPLGVRIIIPQSNFNQTKFEDFKKKLNLNVNVNKKSQNFNVENNVKAGAVADCMEQNNKKQCYLYAMKGEIIWENSQPANTSSSPVESTKSAESGLSNSSTKEKLLELKTLLNDGLISQDEYDKKRSEILDSL